MAAGSNGYSLIVLTRGILIVRSDCTTVAMIRFGDVGFSSWSGSAGQSYEAILFLASREGNVWCSFYPTRLIQTLAR